MRAARDSAGWTSPRPQGDLTKNPSSPRAGLRLAAGYTRSVCRGQGGNVEQRCNVDVGMREDAPFTLGVRAGPAPVGLIGPCFSQCLVQRLYQDKLEEEVRTADVGNSLALFEIEPVNTIVLGCMLPPRHDPQARRLLEADLVVHRRIQLDRVHWEKTAPAVGPTYSPLALELGRKLDTYNRCALAIL